MSTPELQALVVAGFLEGRIKVGTFCVWVSVSDRARPLPCRSDDELRYALLEDAAAWNALPTTSQLGPTVWQLLDAHER